MTIMEAGIQNSDFVTMQAKLLGGGKNKNKNKNRNRKKRRRRRKRKERAYEKKMAKQKPQEQRNMTVDGGQNRWTHKKN